MSDIGWIMVVVCVYYICKAVVKVKNGKDWDE